MISAVDLLMTLGKMLDFALTPQTPYKVPPDVGGWVFYHKDWKIRMKPIDRQYAHKGCDCGKVREVPRKLSWAAYSIDGSERYHTWNAPNCGYVPKAIENIKDKAIIRVVQGGVHPSSIVIDSPHVRWKPRDLGRAFAGVFNNGQRRNMMQASHKAQGFHYDKKSAFEKLSATITEPDAKDTDVKPIAMHIHLVQPLHNTRTDRESKTYKRSVRLWNGVKSRILDSNGNPKLPICITAKTK